MSEQKKCQLFKNLQTSYTRQFISVHYNRRQNIASQHPKCSSVESVIFKLKKHIIFGLFNIFQHQLTAFFSSHCILIFIVYFKKLYFYNIPTQNTLPPCCEQFILVNFLYFISSILLAMTQVKMVVSVMSHMDPKRTFKL